VSDDAADAVAGRAEPPVITVLSGHPDTDEVAALVTVLSALSAAPRRRDVTPPPGGSPNGWAAHWRRVGARPAPGPDTWVWTGRG